MSKVVDCVHCWVLACAQLIVHSFRTYRDLVIHCSISIRSRSSVTSGNSPIRRSVGLEIISHLRIQLLSSFLCWASATRVATSTLLTLTSASITSSGLSACCRFWLGFWCTEVWLGAFKFRLVCVQITYVMRSLKPFGGGMAAARTASRMTST